MREQNKGSKSLWAKLNEQKVKDIKVRLMNGATLKELANEYSVSLEAISGISQNRSWLHVEVEGWNDYINRKKLKQPKRKLSHAEVIEIREMLGSNNNSITRIAEKFGIYTSTVSNIKLGKTHKQVV